MNRTRYWRLAMKAVILVFVVTGGEGRGHEAGLAGKFSPTGAQSPATRAATPTKLALLIGIDDYLSPQISPLAGSINDVEDMLQVLTTKFEFDPKNIKVLKNAEATRANIIGAFQNYLIPRAKEGDIVVVHYSGHGALVPDPTGKKISGLDGTIVPYDSRQGNVFDIRGMELHGLLLQLARKTKNVTFILDACHSGGVIRGIDTRAARVRSIPPDTRPQPPLPSYAAERGLGNFEEGPPLKFVVVAAATSKESAYEYVADSKDRGALTYFLAQQLRNAKAGATWRDVYDPTSAAVIANFPAQDPQLEGVEADQRVFGDSSSVARPYVLISPLDARRAKLSVGQVEGATVGSVYDVYRPGAKTFAPPEQSVARVQLTKVDAFESEGNIISGGKIVVASRAVERSHRYGASKMRVYFDQLDGSPVLQSIRNALQPFKHIEVVSNPAACHMQLRQVQGRIQTLGADLSILSPSLSADDPAVVTRSVERIKSWAKFFNVLSIRNLRSGIDVQFTLKAGQSRDPMARVGKPDAGVFEGESITASLKNNSERELYVVIIDMSSDGTISLVYPTLQGAQEVLTSGSTLTRTFKTFIPPTVSPARKRIWDILKVFASYKPIDLTPLTQGPIRDVGPSGTGDPDDPLQDLLMDSTGTRQVAPQPYNVESWTTVQRLLVVKRKN